EVPRPHAAFHPVEQEEVDARPEDEQQQDEDDDEIDGVPPIAGLLIPEFRARTHSGSTAPRERGAAPRRGAPPAGNLATRSSGRRAAPRAPPARSRGTRPG